MNNKSETHILKLSCKDQIGIVANISSILAKCNCNIVESKQFTDQINDNFCLCHYLKIPTQQDTYLLHLMCLQFFQYGTRNGDHTEFFQLQVLFYLCLS